MPAISHLRVFGSRCFIKVPDKNCSKFDNKARESCLNGLEGDSIYVVVDVGKEKLCSCNIIFMEG